jgi:hypothetical protein
MSGKGAVHADGPWLRHIGWFRPSAGLRSGRCRSIAHDRASRREQLVVGLLDDGKPWAQVLGWCNVLGRAAHPASRDPDALSAAASADTVGAEARRPPSANRGRAHLSCRRIRSSQSIGRCRSLAFPTTYLLGFAAALAPDASHAIKPSGLRRSNSSRYSCRAWTMRIRCDGEDACCRAAKLARQAWHKSESFSERSLAGGPTVGLFSSGGDVRLIGSRR